MDRHKSTIELVDAEKQMVALIHSKGVLEDGILDLYRKIRTGYEETLLSTSHAVELQEVEYHLWRLHYHLIDEFRRKIRNRAYPLGSVGSESRTDKVVSRGFELFLSEVNEFYKKLIVELRKSRGPAVEVSVERTCHRLLICLGDLARYTEIVKRPDACEWSIAATYYFQATRTWPDSGNPHNQLALLATYSGDAFLALYHCVRSLAVKEPFPDAWRNIMLLFEENRSTKLGSFSSKMQLDFLNPSKKSYLQNASHEDNDYPEKAISEDPENVCSEKSDLWPLLVRTISFLLIGSSLEEFSSTLASALHCLEGELAMDDMRIILFLESYQNLDSSRRGPYRAIQLVSIFIFIVHSLTERGENEESKPTGKHNEVHSTLKPLALTAIFICLGRLTERCHKGQPNQDTCSLLPAVLVFIEWLEGALNTVETYEADVRVKNALSYFYATLADLLDRVKQNGDEIDMDHTALWEDHELKGFYPLTRVHERLDFDPHHECTGDYTSRNRSRLQRVFQAGKRISDVSQSFRLFKSLKMTKPLDCESYSGTKAPPEDEEVILFKPITRRNSAPPVYIPEPEKGSNPSNGKMRQTPLADEWLRHATSLSTSQNTEDTESFSFSSTTSNKESPLKDPRIHSTGPPSLSAWNIEIESGPHGFNKQKLSPIEETVSTSLLNLSINGEKDTTPIRESPPRATSIPSAPLLPDDATWLRGNSPFPSEHKNEANSILGAAPIIRSTIRPPSIDFADVYHPPFLGMSSSEWLYRYRHGQNMSAAGAGNHVSPIHFDAPPFVNFHQNEVSSFDLCDQWGNHFVSSPVVYLGGPQPYPVSSIGYGVEEPEKRDRYFVGFQRTYPYEHVMEEPTLLQYLKEKERQLQLQQPQLRGPT